MHVSLPPLQALGEACTEAVGWGKGGGKTGCVHTDRGGEGVLYHTAGEPGTGGKAADVGGNGVFYLHGRVCVHTGTVEGREKAESLFLEKIPSPK